MRIAFSFLISFIFYLLSISVVKNDSSFSYRWIAFSLWTISILFLPVTLIIKEVNKKIFNKKIKFTKRELISFLFIFFLSILLSFIFLAKYPFVSIYDQVRDGGLNGMQIAQGTLKNIFGYGRYSSHGLIIPTITSFFYLIFKNSVLTFRFPSAIISVLDVLTLYLIARKIFNKEMAFWSSLVLLTLPLHLYYSRTEIVPIFSSLFTSLIFLLFTFFIKNKTINLLSLFGLALGFFSGFHTSIRTVSILTLIIISLITLFDIYKKSLNKNFLLGILLMFVFYFIGFGPRILFTNQNIFFQTRSLANQNNLGNLILNYQKSLFVYFKEPTIGTHYPDFKPLLSPILSTFFIFGFLFSLFTKDKFLRYILLYVLLIPFLNSAVTESVNSDNRLLPLLPVSALLVGFGIYSLNGMIKKLKFEFLFLPLRIFLFAVILYQAFSFFFFESASKQYSVNDYLSMQAIYFLKSNNDHAENGNTCFFISPQNLDYFRLMHVQEQYQYFLPDKFIRIIENNSLKENELFISQSCNQNLDNFTTKTYCSLYQKFTCPKNNNLKLLVEKKDPKNLRKNIFNSNLFTTPTFIIEPNVKSIP